MHQHWWCQCICKTWSNMILVLEVTKGQGLGTFGEIWSLKIGSWSLSGPKLMKFHCHVSVDDIQTAHTHTFQWPRVRLCVVPSLGYYTKPLVYQWLSPRLSYIQCISNGDTALLPLGGALPVEKSSLLRALKIRICPGMYIFNIGPRAILALLW